MKKWGNVKDADISEMIDIVQYYMPNITVDITPKRVCVKNNGIKIMRAPTLPYLVFFLSGIIYAKQNK